MRKFMANMATAKQILWECVELGFVGILAVMLIYLDPRPRLGSVRAVGC